MTAPVRLRTLDAAAAREAQPQWTALYNSCFTAPPWNEPVRSADDYVTAKEWHFRQRGFRCVEAYVADELVGVAYGWPVRLTAAAHPFGPALAATLGEAEVADLWAADPFELAEVMIAPAARGQGLGRRLVDAACEGRAVCWLATDPDAEAVGFYRQLGWRPAGTFSGARTGRLALYLRDHR